MLLSHPANLQIFLLHVVLRLRGTFRRSVWSVSTGAAATIKGVDGWHHLNVEQVRNPSNCLKDELVFLDFTMTSDGPILK